MKLYQHYKGGLYIVIETAKDSTNDHVSHDMVMYYSLAKQTWHVRRLSEFVQEVRWPTGGFRPRFSRVTHAEDVLR